MAHLQITNLRKSYGPVSVLKGLNFEIKSGEMVSLLGPSGSGKTTALRCIAGLERPDASSGAIKVDQTVFSSGETFLEPEDRGVGMVFQSYAVWPHMNVYHNVVFPLGLQVKRGKVSATEARTRALDALKLVKLDPYQDRFANQLSGGQQQRVALARALAMSPKILFLDEPLSNLDALLREELGAEIRRLQKKLGLTTVMVTHDQKEALSLSDRIFILRDGQIEASGAPEELYQNPTTPFVGEFISGGQNVVDATGAKRQFLPRRWRVLASPAAQGLEGRVGARIFLGNEYEYFLEVSAYQELIRMYSADRFEIGAKINVQYQ